MADKEKLVLSAFDGIESKQSSTGSSVTSSVLSAFDSPVKKKEEQSPLVGTESSPSLGVPTTSEEPTDFDYTKYDDLRVKALTGDALAAAQFSEMDKQKTQFEKAIKPNTEGISSIEEAKQKVASALEQSKKYKIKEKVDLFRSLFPGEIGDEKDVEALLTIKWKLLEADAIGDDKYGKYARSVKVDLANETANNILSTINESIAKIDDAKKRGISNLGKGVVEGIGDYVKDYYNIFATIGDNKQVKSIEEKIKRIEEGSDETFTAGEKNLIDALVVSFNAAPVLDKELPESRRIGSMLGQSLGFMVEFGLTGGAGSIGKKALIKGAVKIGATGTAAKVGINAMSKLAAVGVQTIKMPTFYKETAVNVSNGQSLPSAAAEALYDTGLEALSERLFTGKIPDGAEATNIVTKVASRLGSAVTGAKGWKGILRAIGEEYLEEKFSETGKGIKEMIQGDTTFDEFSKEFVDPMSNFRTAAVTTIMAGSLGAAQEATRGIIGAGINSSIKSAGAKLSSNIRSNIDEIVDNKDLTVQEKYQLVYNAVKKEGLDDSASKQLLADAQKYATYKMQRLAFDGVEQARKKKSKEQTMEEQAQQEVELPTVGEMKPVEEMQKQLDYLKERGVEVEDGATAEDIKNKYDIERTVDLKKRSEELDARIVEAQQRLGLPEVPPVSFGDNIELTLDKLDQGEEIQDEDIKDAADELYAKYKELEAMKQSDTRQYTTEQIESMQEFIGEEITNLDNYAKRKQTGEPVGKDEVSTIAETGAGEVTSKETEQTSPIEIPRISVEPLSIQDSTTATQKEESGSQEPKQIPFSENKENVSFVAEKIAKGESLTNEDLQLQKNFPTEVEVELTKIKENEKSKSNSDEAQGRQGRQEGLLEAQKKISEQRKQQIADIDAEIGDLWSDLADIVGAKKSLTGEQRKKLAPVVAQLVQAYAKKYSLKGAELIDAVKAHFVSKGITVDEDLDELIKQESNAERITSEATEASKQTQELEQGEKRQVRVGDSKQDRADEKEVDKKAEDKYKGQEVKNSRAGVRFAFGDKFSEKAKEAYRDGDLYTYTPESHEEIAAIAQSIYDLNPIDVVERAFNNTNIPRRIRVGLGALLATHYSGLSDRYATEGNMEMADQYADLTGQTFKKVQDELSIEIGRDLSFFGSEFYSSLVTPYGTARQVERAYENKRKEIEKSKGYKRTKKAVVDGLYDLRKAVMKEVNKQSSVVKAKQKAEETKTTPKKETDPFKEKIRKERKDLVEELKKRKSSTMSVSVIPFLTNDDIEIGGKIALTYIQEGIYDVKKLIAKVKNDFKKAGINITNAEAKRMLPEEINGKKLSVLEEEQAKEAAAERLATAEFGYIIDQKAKESDPVNQMVSTLVSKFRERAKKGASADKKSTLDIIKEAILNKTEYMSVWTEARDKALSLIEENEDLSHEEKVRYSSEINKAYKNATEFSVSEKKVQQLIREELKEVELSIDDIIRDHYERRSLHKSDLIRALQDKANLSEEAANELADVVNHAFETLMTEKGEALVNRYVKGKTTERKKQGVKTETARIIELVNNGAFDSKEFNDVFSEAYGIPKMTKEVKDEIIRRGKYIQSIKSSDKKHIEEQALLTYIFKQKGVDMTKEMTGLWYAHVLSGISTHLKNASDASVSTLVETMVLAGVDAKKAKIAAKSIVRGFKGEGWQRLLDVISTGNTSLHKKIDEPSTLEMGDIVPRGTDAASKTAAFIFNKWKSIAKFVPRLLNASDNIVFSAAKEGVSSLIITEDVIRELEILKGRKLNREERGAIETVVQNRMSLTKEQVDQIKVQVDLESEDLKVKQKEYGVEPNGYTEREKKLRTYELINQARGADVTGQAFDIAGRILGNTRIYGTAGFLIDKIAGVLDMRWDMPKYEMVGTGKNRFLRKHPTKTIPIRPLGLIMPFTTIVANVQTRNLAYNPIVGAIRATTGQIGFGMSKDNRYARVLSPLEKEAAKRKVMYVLGIQSMLYALLQLQDDDDPWFDITYKGAGALEYKKNDQLKLGGWKPTSIKIGDKYYDYRSLGVISMILMPLGYMRDHKRYTDTEMNDLELYGAGLLVSIIGSIEATPISGLLRVTDAVSQFMQDPVENTDKLMQVFGSMGTGFVAPNTLKDIESMYDVLADNSQKKTEGVIGNLLQRVPIINDAFAPSRIRVDVLGQPVPEKLTTAQILESVGKNEIVRYYTQQGYFRPVPSIKTTTFELINDKGGIDERPIDYTNKKELALFTLYEMKSGQLFAQEAESIKKQGLTGAEAVAALEEAWSMAQSIAKTEVYLASETNPVKAAE